MTEVLHTKECLDKFLSLGCTCGAEPQKLSPLRVVVVGYDALADLELCDRCGEPVPFENDAINLDFLLYPDDAIMLLFARSRHLLPTGRCPGSPSRAQYLYGQPPDKRRKYRYDPTREVRVRSAYQILQFLARERRKK